MGLLEVGLDLWWVGFGLFFVEQTRMAQDRPNWAVFGSEVTAVAPDGILMQVFGSDFTTVSPDGIVMQGQCLPTPN
ncbi:hypothetical protein CRG98_010275 [Punica granatum]|uniref:Uncharacterized protein n=1 Tax=Punica granatum TaxID=22663 RepID=A0A2I0KLF2_PUNGR|nr:hypothetical protein CRG98_010275 [Punica granatum]